MHADRDVVDLTMMEAALVAVEDLEGLVLGADSGEAFLRERERNLFVARAMQEQKRAPHLLHDPVEPELFELLRPDGVIVPLRPPGDAAGKARLERGRSRRVIATETERHHTDTAGVELAATAEIFVSRGGVALGLRDQWQIAKAHALTVSRAIHDETAYAARSKIGNAVAVLELLGDVEAVEEHHARRRSRPGRCGLGMHKERRQARAFVRHLDRFDARPAYHRGGGLEELHGGRIDRHAALRTGMNKALTGLVVARRAHEARRCGELMAFRLCVAPAGCDLVAHASPFFEPRGVVAYATFERTADTMHLVDFDACPRRSAKTNEQAHGPAVIGRKIKEGGVVLAADHVYSPVVARAHQHQPCILPGPLMTGSPARLACEKDRRASVIPAFRRG